MNIIFGNEHVDQHITELKERYVLLPLDRIRFKPDSDYVQAWCILSDEEIELNDVPFIEKQKLLHEQMMHEYRHKNWKFCNDALEVLRGKFKGNVDSFYETLGSRVAKYIEQDPGETWDGIYEKFDSINNS